MSEIELTPFEQHEQEFLDAPDVAGLLKLYEFLVEDLKDHELAGVLDKIRPIQHRVTLIQADATAQVLEALCRDPHRDVRSVVATHANISEEVCFRLCEDPESMVRLALRKNPACHPVVHASLVLRERPGEENRVRSIQLLEIAWQARRAELARVELVALMEEWLEVGPESFQDLSDEQIGLVLDVLGAKLGQGAMPRKPRRAPKKSGRSPQVSGRSAKASGRASKASGRAAKVSTRAARVSGRAPKASSKTPARKKSSTKKSATKKSSKKKR